jgi:hypothetical protein
MERFYMNPALAAALFDQLSQLQPSLTDLGAIESARFLGVGAQGEDLSNTGICGAMPFSSTSQSASEPHRKRYRQRGDPA